MEQVKTPALAILLLAALLLGLAACSSPEEGGAPAARQPAGEPIIVSIPADVQKLDPPQPTDGNSLLVISHLFDTLVDFHETDVAVVPGLAKSWDVSEDGLRYTFHLRDDATFTNGDPVDAAAVRYTFERIVDTKHPEHFSISWRSYILGDWFNHIETPDDRTVVFVLNRPFVPLLYNLAIPAASIVHPGHVREMGADRVVSSPMGSGPYELEEWKPGAYVAVKARESHWRGTPKTQRLVFRVQRDQNQTMSALRTGDSHLAVVLTPSVIGDRARLGEAVILDFPILSMCHVYLNVAKPSMESPALRRALNFAVDRQAICETLLEGMGTPAYTSLPPGMLGHRTLDEIPSPFRHDPEEARRILAEAGLSNVKLTMHCFNEARPYNPVGVRLAQRLQEDFRQVGIELELIQMDFGGWIETVDQRTVHEMALAGWSADTGDPDNFIQLLFLDETNRSNYKNPEALALMVEAQGEGDPERRAALYQQAEDLMFLDPPAITISHARGIKGASKRLRGYTPHPIRNDYLGDAWLAEE
jgi:peptide/nickel transport system substrate-binding protein